MGVGERIRRWRLIAGITQADLAARLGVSRPAVCQWESGETEPRQTNLEKVAEACGVSMQTFWGDIGGDQNKAA